MSNIFANIHINYTKCFFQNHMYRYKHYADDAPNANDVATNHDDDDEEEDDDDDDYNLLLFIIHM